MADRPLKRKRAAPAASAPAPPGSTGGMRIEWWQLAVVLLLTFIAYSNSFRAPLLFDNDEIIVQDARVHANTAENLRLIFGAPYHPTKPTGLYRPLTTWSYLFNYAILGDGASPDGYHWLNLLLHMGNILLVYAMARALISDRRAALAAAAIWGLHPIATESVVNIVGRADLLSTFGVLACVLSAREAVAASRWRMALWLGAVAAASGVAVGAKESGVVAGAAAALYVWTFCRESAIGRRIAAAAAAFAPAAVYLIARARVLGGAPAAIFSFTDNPLLGAGFWSARVTAFKVIGKGAALLLWPYRLSPDYSYNEIPVGVDAGGVLALAMCVAAAGCAVWAWRRHKPAFFAIAFYFLALAPVSNVFLRIGAILAERFLYLPSVGLALGLVYGAGLLWDRKPGSRTAISVAVCAVALVFAARTHARNEDWNDIRSLWGSAVEAAPGSYKTHLNYGAALPTLRAAERARAVAELDRALAICAPLSDAEKPAPLYQIAGTVFRQIGDQITGGRAEAGGAGAREWDEKALRAFEQFERTQDALDEGARRNGRMGAMLSSPALEIARTYLRLGNLTQAVVYFEKGRALEPNPQLLDEEAAAIEQSGGDDHRAARLYVEALELDSARTHIQGKLVELYRKIDPQGCAIADGALNVSCPTVHADICGASQNLEATYLRRGDSETAATIRRTATTDLGCGR